jgi:hexosaminidase
MKKVFNYFFLLLLLNGQYTREIDLKDFEKHFKLLPQPQKIEILTGQGITHSSLRSIFLKGVSQKPVLYGVLNTLQRSDRPGPGVLTMIISDDQALPSSPEGYILEIKNGQSTINARGQAGLFYGSQTLLQMLEDANDQQVAIPACRITDYPDIAFRAIHLDLKHHLDAGFYYYQVIDRLARIKINAIIVEFEDKLRFKKAPVVGASHAISIEEFAAISRYAKERNIEISPLVQGLGHASFILKHEQYKKLRDNPESDWSFDAVNPDTYTLQFSLYEDAIAATPYGKYLHVGGDEVGNLGMSEEAKKSGLSAMQLQMQWLQKVCAFARDHNRIPIFWDDMVFKLSGLYQTTWDSTVPLTDVTRIWKDSIHRLDENLNLFPPECVFMRWNYDTPGILGNNNALDWYKKSNLKVMAATAAQTMWPMLPREKSNFQPIKDFCKITSEKKLNGILCTAWDDCSPHFETYWRGFHDFAFFSWNYNDIKAGDLHSIFRQRFYGAELKDTSSEFQDLLEQALVFWETAVLEKGHRNNYPEKIELINLPDPGSGGKWSEVYAQRINRAKEERSRYELIKTRIQHAMKVSRRNEFSLALMNQINELQAYPSGLLLLMEKYDRASSGSAKQDLKEQIKNYVNHFDVLKKNFEDTFSKTRILNNPDDYLLDQNVHEHLANGSNKSDWMYIYELAMNKKLNNWLTN